MAKRSKSLESLINWARSAKEGDYSPVLPNRIRTAIQREFTPDGGPDAGTTDRDVLVWRQMLAVMPLDAASFKGLYGPELDLDNTLASVRATGRETVAGTNSRRQFLEDIAWCCEKQMDRVSDDPYAQDGAATGSLGYLAVLFLTLLTMEDADDRRFDDLADWGVTPASDAEPARVSAAQQYGDTCKRLFAYDEVGEALCKIYEPDWTEHRSSAEGFGRDYDATKILSGERELPKEAHVVEFLTATRAREIWEELDFEGMAFHRCGTTSFIVRTPWRALPSKSDRPDAAVKFVLLPYAELAAIERSSSQYWARYGPLTNRMTSAVTVQASTRNLIVMDFLEGDTLAQRVQRMQEERLNRGEAEAPRTSGMSRRFADLRRFFAVEDSKDDAAAQRFASSEMLLTFGEPLFDALTELLANKVVHQDINPSNIIVVPHASKLRLVLIDFGRNYLYDQAGLSREGADAVYIAPEIRSSDTPSSDTRDYLPDVYSLGQLLIALSGVGRDAEGVVPDAFYRRTPLLARFLEDLTERDPALRLLLNRPRTRDSNPYAHLKTVFKANVHATIVADRDDGVFGPPSRRRQIILTYGPVSGAVRRLRRLRDVTSEQNSTENAEQGNPWFTTSQLLYRWSVCSAVMWYGCLALLAYLVLADLGIVPVGFLAALARDGYQVPPDRIAENLTARITGVTFCLAAVKYYQNIYSNLTTRVLPEMSGRLNRLQYWTEFWVRLNAIFVALVVVPVNLLQPSWWTFGGAIGLVDSLMVNFTGSLFALVAVQQARTPTPGRADRRPQLSTVPQNIPGLSMYRMWAPSMAAYVGIVVFFATLINADVLHDDLAYATVVSVLNVALFYMIKCGINAEPVRIGLTRAYLAAERLGRARSAGLIPEAANEDP